MHNVKIDSAASIGGQRKYMKYVKIPLASDGGNTVGF
jgi:hypothetical protein